MRSRSEYREPLTALEAAGHAVAAAGQLGRFFVTTEFARLILRWELEMIEPAPADHPFDAARALISAAYETLHACMPTAGFGRPVAANSTREMEEKHHELFQALWVNFDEQDFADRVQQYKNRLRINDLLSVIKDADCIDFGCGHGNFAHALVQSGAAGVLGVDFGEASVAFAQRAAERLNEERVRFRCASVYETGERSGGFDLAIQNGVFHHLDDEDRAYREVHRVLRAGARLWVYTDGSDSIQGDIQDAAARVVGALPVAEVNRVLDSMGLSVGKRYHLGDSLQATYRHTTPDALVRRLDGLGFTFVRRLVGGAVTDTDGPVLRGDRWAVERFGTGDIRMLFVKR